MSVARRRFLQIGVGGMFGAVAGKTVLVVATDARWLECAGGTVAKRIEDGAPAVLVRVGNDEKDAWELTREEAAWRNRTEAEAAAKLLGIGSVIPLGYQSSELQAVPHTTIRDRLILLIRRYRPATLIIPNPHAEHDRNLDSYYVGAAAEDAWHCARFPNFLPAANAEGLKPFVVPEVYYYAPPLDPRRREPESTATFVPQPVRVDISASFAKKLRAAQAMRTYQRNLAMRLKERLTAQGRRLPLLDQVTDASVDKLVEENLRGLGVLCAEGSEYKMAEEFRHAGISYGIPSKYLR